MSTKWLRVLRKTRRGIWLTELVTVLLLLLVYKFTESELTLALTIISVLVASMLMAVATVLLDQIEIEHLGEDEPFHDAS